MKRAAAPIVRTLLQGSSRGTQACSTIRQLSTPLTLDERARRLFDFERVDENTFRAPFLTAMAQQSVKAAYGRLIMAQALAAAEATIGREFKPHSAHSYFILSVDTTIPVDYRVRRLRDGRSFCTRAVEAVQNGRVAFSLQASFHILEPDSVIHQSDAPKETRSPDDCVELDTQCFPPHVIVTKTNLGWLMPDLEAGTSEAAKKAFIEYAQLDRDNHLFDVRCTNTKALFGIGNEIPDVFHFWIKSKIHVPPEKERLNRWLVTFASDASAVRVMFAPHHRNNFAPSMRFSLDHILHFHHHDLSVNDWLLYELESTTASNSRAFVRGRIWSQQGSLLVSVTQEALIRSRDGSVSSI